MPNKICFVVQRYGLEVNGGAELLTRQFAEKMKDVFDITVVTTQAIDYQTWRNEYNEKETVINGVKVLRFPVDKERNLREFAAVNHEPYDGMSDSGEQEWIDKQGPYCPKMIDYIRNHKDDYDLFVFFTYLYYQTVMGIREVRDKAVLVPFAHDEPFLRIRKIGQVFKNIRGICFETEEERFLIRQRFNNFNVPYTMLGAGVDVPETVDSERFKKKYNLDNYIIYVGRIDVGKNCPEMFDSFLRYKEENPSDLKLVLMGKPVCEIPESEDIVSLGFVSDEDKFDGIKGSKLLLLPSEFESLSLVVLEAFQLHIPVVVNGKSPVLKGHCVKSNGGYWYGNYKEFSEDITDIINNPKLQKELGDNGYQYVYDNFRWEVICQKMKDFFEFVIKNMEKES